MTGILVILSSLFIGLAIVCGAWGIGNGVIGMIHWIAEMTDKVMTGYVSIYERSRVPFMIGYLLFSAAFALIAWLLHPVYGAFAR